MSQKAWSLIASLSPQVISGINFALPLIARLFGEDMAKCIQLNLQYAPTPPFQGSTPDEAPPHIDNYTLERFPKSVKRILENALFSINSAIKISR